MQHILNMIIGNVFTFPLSGRRPNAHSSYSYHFVTLCA